MKLEKPEVLVGGKERVGFVLCGLKRTRELALLCFWIDGAKVFPPANLGGALVASPALKDEFRCSP